MSNKIKAIVAIFQRAFEGAPSNLPSGAEVLKIEDISKRMKLLNVVQHVDGFFGNCPLRSVLETQSAWDDGFSAQKPADWAVLDRFETDALGPGHLMFEAVDAASGTGQGDFRLVIGFDEPFEDVRYSVLFKHLKGPFYSFDAQDCETGFGVVQDDVFDMIARRSEGTLERVAAVLAQGHLAFNAS